MLGPSRASGKHMGTDQTGTPIRRLRFVRVLSSRDVDAVLDGRLGLARRPGAGKQSLAPQPIKLGFKRRSSRLSTAFSPAMTDSSAASGLPIANCASACNANRICCHS